MKIVSVTILAILAVASQTAQANPVPESTSSDVSIICDGKFSGPLSVQQVQSFAAQLREGPSTCAEHIKSAIEGLDNLLKWGQENACSTANAHLGVQFFENHIRDQKEEMPEPLEVFLLNYLMRTSQLCKTRVVEFLTGEANELLKPEDFESLSTWTADGGEIESFMADARQVGVDMPPSDLAAWLTDYSTIDKAELNPQLQDNVGRIKRVCNKRFEPVYEGIMMPPLILTRAGFDYADDSIKNELSLSEEERKRLEEFNRIVFLCEFMNLVVGEPDEMGADERPLEEIVFEPKGTVSMPESIEPLRANELTELVEKLRAHEPDIFSDY